jgi:competence protein ComEC
MGVSFLFTGDAPEEVETKLLEYKGMGMLPSSVQLNSTEILKVSHHGSISASSEKFLRYLNLKTAVISCGKDNEYKHPHAEVLDRLQTAGAKIYRTDQQGHIIVTVTKDGQYTVDTL